MAEPLLRRYRTALAHRDFRLLVVAFLVDATGSWASTVVVSVWVYQRTGSLALLAVLTASSWIPGLLIGPVGGVIADRYDRRTVMVFSAGLCAVLVGGQALVVGLDGPVGLLPVLAAAAAVVGNPYRPAAGALTPAVVDEAALPAANSLFATLENLVVVVGPAIGGLLALVGAAWIGVTANALSFVVAAAIALALRVRSRGDAGGEQGVLAQFAGGVRALAATPTASVLLAFAALDSLIANAYTVVYIPIGQHVGIGTAGYGALLAGCALGGVLGAGLAERLAAAPRLAPVIVGGLLVQALPWAATALTGVAGVAIALQAVSGAGMIVVDVLALTAIQREVPSGALSRVLSLVDMAALSAGLVGSFGLAGLLAALPYGVVLVVLGVGASVVAVALSPLLVRADRRAAARTAQLAAIVTRFEAIELLQHVPRTGLERLAAAASERRLRPGEVLIRQGEPADAIYALVDGRLDVSAVAGEGSVALPPVDAPDAVGEIGVLRARPRTATVVAATDAIVYRIAGADFLDALTPERAPIAFAGGPSVRLARTDVLAAAPA